MQTQALAQISLIAAYLAGIVALFAPCCISYLLPAYLGNIFKEKKKILLMTLVYSLGIFVVMLPVVLGAKILADLIFNLHDQTYIAGGVVMLVVAFLSLIGFKLPMPYISMDQKGTGVLSTFSLGIFSGITSACCAPVLVGAITLSTLSPSILMSLAVGLAYVFGMVSPLYLASVLIDKKNLFAKPWLKKKVTLLHLGAKTYPIFISNLIAFAIFFITGWLLILLTLAGKLSMPDRNSGTTQLIQTVAMQISQITNQIPFINLLFIISLVLLILRFRKK